MRPPFAQQLSRQYTPNPAPFVCEPNRRPEEPVKICESPRGNPGPSSLTQNDHQFRARLPLILISPFGAYRNELKKDWLKPDAAVIHRP
jgi:hypothetical protein